MKKNSFLVSLAILALVGSLVGAALFFTTFAEPSITDDSKKEAGELVGFEPTSPPSESYYQNKTGSTANALGVSLRQSIVNTGNPLYQIDNFNSLANRTFGIDCPQDKYFNSTFTNITITNIVAPDKVLDLEKDDDIDPIDMTNTYAFSFDVTSNCTLKEFSVCLSNNLGTASSIVDFYIYNATWTGSRYDPNKDTGLLNHAETIPITDYKKWYTISVNQQLNINKTEGKKFFIRFVARIIDEDYPQFNEKQDLNDPYDSLVRFKIGSGSWQSVNYEICSNVSLGLSDTTPKPTDIGLMINNTFVSNNGTSNSGFWISTVKAGSDSGRLNFTLSANWWDIKCNITRIQVNYTKTNLGTLVKYNASKTDPRVQWNVSITTLIDDFSSKFLCHRINFSIPIDWDALTAKAFNGTKQRATNFVVRVINGYKQIEVLEAGNGTNWYLTCNSTNLLDTESSVQFLEYNAPITTASHSSIVDVKAAFKKPIKTPNPVNLSIYWPSNYTTKTELYTKLNSSIPNRVSTVLLGSWNISKNISSNQYGDFRVQVFWTNGTAVGYRERILKIIPEKNTVLTQAAGSSTTITVTRGANANYSFYYNTSTDNKAVENAIVYNLIMPSGMVMQSGFEKYEGNGRYKISLNTSLVTNGVSNAQYKFTVARSGYVGQTKILTITVEIPKTRIDSLASSVSGSVAAEGQNITLQFKVYDDFKNKPILTISQQNITVKADGLNWDRADPKFVNRGWLLQSDGKGNYTLVISTYQLSKGVQYTIVINVSYASLNPGPYQSSIVNVQFYYANVPPVSGDDDDNGGGGNGGTTGVPIEQLILWIVVIAAIVCAIGIAAVSMKKATHKKTTLKKNNLIQANTLMKDALNIRYFSIYSKALENKNVFANFYSIKYKSQESKYRTIVIDIVKRIPPSDPFAEVFVENTNYLVYNSASVIVALVLNEKASSYLVEKLKRFAVDFEHQYILKLGDRNEMSREMPKIAQLIDKYFDTSLAQPYTLDVLENATRKFSSLETVQVLKLAERLYDDAEKRTAGQPHFYLNDLIATAVKQRMDFSDALASVRELIKEGILITANVVEEEEQKGPSELDELRDKIRGGPSETEINEVSKLLSSLNVSVPQGEVEINKFKTMSKRERIQYVDRLKQALGIVDRTEVIGDFGSHKNEKSYFLNATEIGKKAKRSKDPQTWSDAIKTLNNALKEAQKHEYNNLINDYNKLQNELWVKGLNHYLDHYTMLGDRLFDNGSYRSAHEQYTLALEEASNLYNRIDESEKKELNKKVDKIKEKKRVCEQKIRDLQ